MSRQRSKGTAFETSLLPLLREYYPDASRAPLRGTKDQGDFILPGERRFILEAKNQKQMKLPEWLDEAADEAFNAWVAWGPGVKPPVGVVVHKRQRVTAPEDQYVTMRLEDLLRLVNA